MRHGLVWVAGILCVYAGGVAAQGPEHLNDALTPGRHAIATELRSGAAGTMFGVWKVVAPDRARGLFLTVSASAARDRISGAQTTTDYAFSATVGPRVRHYLAHEGPVAGFGEAGLGIGAGYHRRSASASVPENVQMSEHDWNGIGRADLGVGAEWFPLSRISVALRTGLQLTTSVGRTVSGQDRITTWSAGLNTFLSSVTAQLYF